MCLFVGSYTIVFAKLWINAITAKFDVHLFGAFGQKDACFCFHAPFFVAMCLVLQVSAYTLTAAFLCVS